MTTLRFEIKGAQDLQRALRQASASLEELKQANRETAQIVTTAAQGRSPRRSGALAASGRPTGGAKKATITFGSASVPYARPIHWGWPARKIKPQPFAMEAVDQTQPEWFHQYEAEIKAILQREDLNG